MKGPKIWGFLLALCLVSCGTVRQVTNSDNTTVQVKTETVYHTDTIYVELPQIIQSIQTRDTLSRLENDYAKSEAVVSNGTLSHSLEIKPTAHPVKVQGKTVYKDSIVFRDRIVETQVEVEKPLTRWQSFKMEAGGALLIAVALLLLLFIIHIVRKFINK